ncbi:MAG TPA: hypothetical protein VGL81_00620 [Polyangiaceae bacterium]|jgi:hypothetical protein
MNEVRKVRTWSLVALGAAVVLPIAVACQPPATNQASNVPPGGAPGYPYPGYPQQPGQPGYPAPGAYPAAGQPGYPAPGTPGQPVYPGAAAPGYPAPGAAPGQVPGAMPGQPTPAPTGSGGPPLAPTDPNSLQGILQGIQNAMQGQTVPGGGAGIDLTDVGLKAHAMRVAPGMQPEGDELKQNLQQGQHAVMMVTLQAGKCYTLVGFSAPGAVADLDLNLLAPPLYMTLAGQDLTHNNTPVIGAHPGQMCPVIAFPLQYKLDVVANKGSGIVAVQLFSKNK